MEETISLKELLQTLRKRIGLILSLTFLAGTVSGLISYFYLTPVYQSSTKLLINQTQEEQSSINSMETQVRANLQLIDTYNEIIKSSRILSMVSLRLGTDKSVGQLNEQISIESTENSQVITIGVKDPNAELAAEIADTTAEVFQNEIVKIMKVDNVNILDAATVNTSPVDPKPLINIAIALVVGLMAGVGLAFLLEYFDSTLKSEQDIERILELPVLGNIAVIDDAKMEELKRRKATRNSVGRGETVGS